MKKKKAAEKDFTALDLPRNHRAMFFDAIKQRFPTFFALCLWSLLFSLPFIVAKFAHVYQVSASIASGVEPAEARLAAHLLFGPIEALTFALYALLFAGLAKIMKNLAWNDPVFFKEDFFEGIKENGARYGLTGALFALSFFSLGFLSNAILSAVIEGFILIVLAPIALWFLASSLYYDLGVLSTCGNAAKLYVRTALWTLLVVALLYFPFALVERFVPSFFLSAILFLVFFLVLVVPVSFAFLHYAVSIFDRFINKENFPAFYRKGLSKDE